LSDRDRRTAVALAEAGQTPPSINLSVGVAVGWSNPTATSEADLACDRAIRRHSRET